MSLCARRSENIFYAKSKNKVDFKWIKGHNNHPQNERCDELAVMASMQKELSIDVFYEKEEAKLL